MKVILLQDVAKIGKRFDIAEVSHGYGLNMLIPKGLAQEATAQNIKNIQARNKKVKSDRDAADVSFSEAVSLLKDKVVAIKVEANEKGHLFEALKSEKISEAFSEGGTYISEQQIHISTPIKETGEHKIDLKEGDVSVSVTINVVAQ